MDAVLVAGAVVQLQAFDDFVWVEVRDLQHTRREVETKGCEFDGTPAKSDSSLLRR